MKSSMFLAATGALLAAAGPIDRRALVVDIVTDWVVVTVTDSEIETATAVDSSSTVVHWGPGAHKHPAQWSSVDPVTTTVQPATSSTPEPVVIVTTATPEPVAAPETTTTTQPDTSVAPTTSTVVEVNANTAVVVAAASSTSSEIAATTTAGQEALASPTDFASTAVYHHNIHRINNSAAAVSWSDEYASSAAILAATCNFHHNVTINGGGYGQNIAMWASTGDPESLGQSAAIARATTDMWYNGEINLFPSSGYGEATPDMTNFESWGHYSQLVWQGTTQVGCAAQFCQAGTLSSTMGGWFTVCNYYPAGNVGGEYGTNVAAPMGESTFTAA